MLKEEKKESKGMSSGRKMGLFWSAILFVCALVITIICELAWGPLAPETKLNIWYGISMQLVLPIPKILIPLWPAIICLVVTLSLEKASNYISEDEQYEYSTWYSIDDSYGIAILFGGILVAAVFGVAWITGNIAMYCITGALVGICVSSSFFYAASRDDVFSEVFSWGKFPLAKFALWGILISAAWSIPTVIFQGFFAATTYFISFMLGYGALSVIALGIFVMFRKLYFWAQE